MLKKTLLAFILVCSFFPKSFGQVESSITEAIQGYFYAQLNQDYELLLDYIYPGLIENAGGREAMKNTLMTIHQNQLKKGIQVREFKLREPIQHTKVGGEIHALVPVTSISKVPGGQLTTENNLIAVSEEGMVHWYFIETTSLDERNIQKVLENWNGSLMLPFKKAPIFKEDK